MKGYIYGIYLDNQLVYIGKTNRSVGVRIGEHLEGVFAERKDSQDFMSNPELYTAWRQSECWNVKILKSLNGNNYELETAEKDLIELFKPQYNKQGVTLEYQYSDAAIWEHVTGFNLSTWVDKMKKGKISPQELQDQVMAVQTWKSEKS